MVRPLLARAGYLQEPTADSALQTATGQRWNEAGAHSPEYWRQKAGDAIKWWDSAGKFPDPNGTQRPR